MARWGDCAAAFAAGALAMTARRTRRMEPVRQSALQRSGGDTVRRLHRRPAARKNGDGQRWTSDEDGGTIAVYGAPIRCWPTISRAIAACAGERARGGQDHLASAAAKGWFVYSGLDGDTIVYERVEKPAGRGHRRHPLRLSQERQAALGQDRQARRGDAGGPPVRGVPLAARRDRLAAQNDNEGNAMAHDNETHHPRLHRRLAVAGRRKARRLRFFEDGVCHNMPIAAVAGLSRQSQAFIAAFLKDWTRTEWRSGTSSRRAIW